MKVLSAVLAFLLTSAVLAQTVTIPVQVTVTPPTATAAGQVTVVVSGSTTSVPIPPPGVTPPPAPVVMTTNSLPPQVTGTHFSVQLIATGGTPPYVWTDIGNPTGVFVSNGALQGTATTAGTFPLVLSVKDSAATPQKVNNTLNLVVTSPVTPPPTGTLTATPNCNLASAAFCDTFSAPAATPGRGGDLNPALWAAARLSGEIVSSGSATANPDLIAPIPACKASFTQTNVFPPNDTLICDNHQLMTAVSIQNYGTNSYMIRQPFDFAGRTGKIDFDVDAVTTSLAGYQEIFITADPVPAPTFREFNNFEVGYTPANGISIKLQNLCGSVGAAPSNVMVYNNYVGTIIAPTFNHTNGCATPSAGLMNHFEIQISQTHVDVYGSDFSTDNGVTFPNYRLIYSANISLPFTRGYVHVDARNHASIKYSFGPDAVYHWDNVGFDGPVLTAPLAYEIPDNTTALTYAAGGGAATSAHNLGYLLLDGTTGKAAGMYDPVNKLNSLTFQNVNVAGAAAAILTFNAFFNGGNHTPSTAWGVSYQFNGGAVRTVNLTTAQIAGMSDSTGGLVQAITAFVVPVPVTDLVQGSNTVQFLPVSAPMDSPPVIANIDLLVTAGAVTPPPVTGNCSQVKGDTPVIFCDTFDAPSATPGLRATGIGNWWGVSRGVGGINFGTPNLDQWNQTDFVNCNGTTTRVNSPNDIQVCNGQLREATNDNNSLQFEAGDVTTLAMYPKQPFDFAGRTGTVSFDVSNDNAGNHAAWPEFWMSDLPVPMPFNHFDSWQALPANGFGVRLAANCQPGNQCECPNANNLNTFRWTVDSAVIVRAYVFGDSEGFGTGAPTVTRTDCVIAPNGPGVNNHVEMRINQNEIDVYATDAGVAPTPTTVRLIAKITNANLTLTRGLVWLEDVHYNADKGDPAKPTQRQHTFTWDNVAFDGPFTYRDFAYDAPDNTLASANGAINIGKFSAGGAQSSWSVPGMPANPQAAAARVLFSFSSENRPNPTALKVTVNGNVHTVPWPYPDQLIYSWRTFAVTVPLTDLVAGTNTVLLGSDVGEVFANVDIVLVNVPGGVPVLPGSNNAYPN